MITLLSRPESSLGKLVSPMPPMTRAESVHSVSIEKRNQVSNFIVGDELFELKFLSCNFLIKLS